jgi:hypothetical protein
LRANGPGVVWSTSYPLDNSALVETQNIQAVNGATIVFNRFDVKNVTITNDAASSLRGSTNAVTGTVGTASQDASALSTFTNATLTGATTALKLQGSESIALNASPAAGTYGLIVTSNAQLQLNGTGAVYSAVGNALGRVLVDNGGQLTGAASVTPHQMGLTVGSGGAVTAGNNPAVGDTVAAQTLSLAGDAQLQAGSTLNVTLFGDNQSSLLSAGQGSFLAGALNVNFAAGYTPSAASQYVVFAASGTGYTGTFANALSGSHGFSSGGYLFDVAYNSGNVVLGNAVAAVPEPSTYALLLAGGAAMGWVLRRRRRSDRD